MKIDPRVSLLAVSAALVVALGLTPPATARAGGEAHVSLQPLASRVDWEDGPFTLRVDVADIDHHAELVEGLAAYEVIIHFDPGVVRVDDVEAGDFVRASGRSVQCFQRDRERGEHALGCVSLGSAPGAQGSGRLATLTFRPLANGISFIALEAGLSDPLGDPIAAQVDGGIVEVVGAPREAPTPDGPGESGGPSQPDPTDGGPTVIGDGELGDIPVPTGEVILPSGEVVIASDTNGDGVIDLDDLPLAGTGYGPPAQTWPATLIGTLTAAGAALLLVGLPIAARGRRA